MHRKPPHVLDQHNAQADRNGPQFADFKRRNLLVRSDKAAQYLFRNQTVGMGNISPSQRDHPWIASQVAFCELRQLPIKTRWQIFGYFVQLQLNKVKVVEQPFGGRRHCIAALGYIGTPTIRFEQYL
ncbi:hypothetical protein, partial [Cypionkella sp.]|uniref:hypothetical protein n=1 Tax=Cypionkella sp. TaxID=2811411 RepID=UPI002636E040